MLRPSLGDLGSRKNDLTRFEPDRLRRPDIGFGHVSSALVKIASVWIRNRNSGMGFDSQVVNTSTIIVKVVIGRGELKRIKRKRVDRVPCTVPIDGGKNGSKARDTRSNRMMTKKGMQLETNGMPRTEETCK